MPPSFAFWAFFGLLEIFVAGTWARGGEGCFFGPPTDHPLRSPGGVPIPWIGLPSPQCSQSYRIFEVAFGGLYKDVTLEDIVRLSV